MECQMVVLQHEVDRDAKIKRQQEITYHTTIFS